MKYTICSLFVFTLCFPTALFSAEILDEESPEIAYRQCLQNIAQKNNNLSAEEIRQLCKEITGEFRPDELNQGEVKNSNIDETNKESKASTHSLTKAEEYPFIVDLGVWFGGEKVATNPHGDDYNAGSGAFLQFGYSRPLYSKYGIYSRSYAGFRYQGAKEGKGENSGLILETNAAKRWKNFYFGVGLHADFFNQVSDFDGNKTKFDDTAGPYISVDYIIGESVGLGLKYHFLNYTSETGEAFSGKQLGLYLTTFQQ